MNGVASPSLNKCAGRHTSNRGKSKQISETTKPGSEESNALLQTEGNTLVFGEIK